MVLVWVFALVAVYVKLVLILVPDLVLVLVLVFLLHPGLRPPNNIPTTATNSGLHFSGITAIHVPSGALMSIHWVIFVDSQKWIGLRWVVLDSGARQLLRDPSGWNQRANPWVLCSLSIPESTFNQTSNELAEGQCASRPFASRVDTHAKDHQPPRVDT